MFHQVVALKLYITCVSRLRKAPAILPTVKQLQCPLMNMSPTLSILYKFCDLLYLVSCYMTLTGLILSTTLDYIYIAIFSRSFKTIVCIRRTDAVSLKRQSYMTGSWVSRMRFAQYGCESCRAQNFFSFSTDIYSSLTIPLLLPADLQRGSVTS